MAIGLLTVKRTEIPLSEFVISAYTMIDQRSESLTDKWIKDINSWCEKILLGMSLGNEYSLKIGDIINIKDVTVIKRRAKKYKTSGYPALITKDFYGWKYWMICPKAFEFAVGERVSITGTIRDIKDGMVFLRQPSDVISFKNK